MTKTKMDYQAEEQIQLRAGKKADDLVERLGLEAPIDPLAIANAQEDLRFGGADFGTRYDGKLEFHPSKQRFLMYYNTKYDDGLPVGQHHPRTRFSVAHELGHYFLDTHNAALRGGKAAHVSLSEFRTHDSLEREADAFAASLLMPTKQAKPIINAAEPSLARLSALADQFGTSLVSAAFRTVKLSHFPCAIAGVRDGQVAWTFVSESLFDAQLYPRRGHFPKNAEHPWVDCQGGSGQFSENEGRAGDWFNIYDNDRLEDIYVTEEYIPVPAMNMMLVLLTMDEDDLYPDDEDDCEDDD